MTVSGCVKAVLSYCGKMQLDLAEYFGMTKQSFNNKIRFDRWTAKDLAKVAAFVGGKLMIVLPNGQQILIDVDTNEDSPDA